MKLILFEETIPLLKKGDIGVIPTDTLYGLVASAMDREAVERVYRVRGRDEGKLYIVLIPDIDSLDRFGISLAKTIEEAGNYFGDSVDFYVDAGTLDSEPSTVMKFENGKPVIVRDGAIKIQNSESATEYNAFQKCYINSRP